jgi:hypothetical protein
MIWFKLTTCQKYNKKTQNEKEGAYLEADSASGSVYFHRFYFTRAGSMLAASLNFEEICDSEAADFVSPVGTSIWE